MERKHRSFYLLLLAFTLAIVCSVTVLYVRQLNQTISDNTVNSISEIAEHDKAAILSYIELCWTNLSQIRERFDGYGCETIEDVVSHMNLERATSEFSHIYLLAEDGTVYTDDPASDPAVGQRPDFLPYFADGRDRIVARFDMWDPEEEMIKEQILYGIRLDHFEPEGQKITALIGLTDISSIQDRIVIDSFVRNGRVRGYSYLIDADGSYLVNINKEIFLGEKNNLFEHLADSESSELTNDEVADLLSRQETFAFYHSHKGEFYQELFYFIPLGSDTDLYFVMSVNEAVFREQSREFVTLSIAVLVICIAAVIAMLLTVMRYQIRTVRHTEAARSQKEFLSNMSHEIRTPLNGLIGMNHLIMVNIDDDSKKPQIREWLRKSHSTANYLLSLVNDILDMSKLQAGKVDLINEPLLVSSLIGEVAAMQSDNIERRGVEFIVEQDLYAPCIEGDATRIKQILMNIVGNAAKFTPKGNYIRLSSRQEPVDELHVRTIFECEDTGIGMSKDYLDRIFDSFSQEQRHNTGGTRGTGLGMAISKLLATAMGGDITVESEPGVGSTFTVTIPARIIREIPKELLPAEPLPDCGPVPAAPERTRPLKILIAEDVDLNAEILIEILSMEGIETVHAQNGREALELFDQSAPGEFDIILMDMKMPVMDGCAAAAAIRKLNRPDAETVVIYACTANTFQEDRDLAIESGMNDFLAKPIDVAVLLKKIDRVTS